MPERLVVDASAALGILLREPGSEAVRSGWRMRWAASCSFPGTSGSR